LINARMEGLKVLPEKQSAKVFVHGGGTILQPGSKYLELSDRCHADPSGRLWKTLLGKDAPEIVVAIDGSGAVRHLVPRKEAQAVLETKYEWAKPRQTQGRDGGGTAAAKYRDERELARRVMSDVLGSVSSFAENDKMRTPSQVVWQILAAAIVAHSGWEGDGRDVEEACIRRKIVEPNEDCHIPGKQFVDALLGWLQKCTGAQARGLLCELVLYPLMDERNTNGINHFGRIAKMAEISFGIDRRAIVAAVRANIKAEAKGKAEPSAAKPKKAGGRKRRAAQEVPDVQG
jgi:hypothetical protein